MMVPLACVDQFFTSGDDGNTCLRGPVFTSGGDGNTCLPGSVFTSGDDGNTCLRGSVHISGDGNICFSAPGHFLEAFGSMWGSAFASKLIDVEITERLIADHISIVSWEWNLMLYPNIDMVQFLVRQLKTTAIGTHGISNVAWINGGEHLAFYIMELVDAFCGNGVLPADINMSYISFLDETPEAQVDGRTPAIGPLWTLGHFPLSKRKTNKWPKFPAIASAPRVGN